MQAGPLLDVFSIIVAIVFAGGALFVGYRVGLKDGFGGGLQVGRQAEQERAEQQRRFLMAKLITARAELARVEELKSLAARSFAEQSGPLWRGNGSLQVFEQIGDGEPHPQRNYFEGSQGD